MSTIRAGHASPDNANRRRSRRGRAWLAGLAAMTLLAAAAGCSTARPAPSSTGSGGPGGDVVQATNDGVITVDWGAPGSTRQRNYNPFSPAVQWFGGAAWFYEPLFYLDTLNDSKPTPWLADSWAANSDYSQITFHLHPGVKWSDGKPFTAADVVYSLMASHEYKGTKLLTTDYGIKSATALNPLTVKLVMDSPGLGNLNTLSTALMYPKHIFESQKLATWLNPNPVGTGPFTLAKFTPQEQTLDVRPDYWHGAFKGVKQVKWVLIASADAGDAAIRNGTVDLANFGIRNPEQYIKAGNQWYLYPGLGQAVAYNNAEPPFNDVNVRRAFSKAVDYNKVFKLYDEGVGLANQSGLSSSWSDYIEPDLDKPVTANPTAARADLAAGGWTVKNGNLTKNGKSYPISMLATSDYVDFTSWSDGVTQQLKQNLGISVKNVNLAYDQYNNNLDLGKFDMAMVDCVGCGGLVQNAFATNPASMDQKDLVPIGKAATANVERYTNDQVSSLLDQVESTTDAAKIKPLMYQLEKIYADQQPFTVFDDTGSTIELNGTHWTGLPNPAQHPHYVGSDGGGPNTTLTLQNLVPVGK